MNNASQLRRNVILNTAGNLVFFASQYLLIILVMRLSGAYANGLLSTAMNLANPILSFACYGMRSFQVSDFTPQYSDRTYLHSRYVTVLAASTVIGESGVCAIPIDLPEADMEGCIHTMKNGYTKNAAREFINMLHTPATLWKEIALPNG